MNTVVLTNTTTISFRELEELLARQLHQPWSCKSALDDQIEACYQEDMEAYYEQLNQERLDGCDHLAAPGWHAPFETSFRPSPKRRSHKSRHTHFCSYGPDTPMSTHHCSNRHPGCRR